MSEMHTIVIGITALIAGGMMVIVAFYMGHRYVRPLVLAAGIAALCGGATLFDGLAVPTGTDAVLESIDARPRRESEEIPLIRREIAKMPLGDVQRVYLLGRLDPQRGFLGLRWEPSVDLARATLEEARAACCGDHQGSSGHTK